VTCYLLFKWCPVGKSREVRGGRRERGRCSTASVCLYVDFALRCLLFGH
jgi:hypothetical protein